MIILWNFEKYYVPLNTFIALRAILNPYDFEKFSIKMINCLVALAMPTVMMNPIHQQY